MTGVYSLLPEGRHGLLAPPGGGEDVDGYLAVGGYAPLVAPDRLLDRIAATGLRGRGGAGFPAAVKLRAVRDAPGPRVVVANGRRASPAPSRTAGCCGTARMWSSTVCGWPRP
ncbi:hypothetical protein WKI71_03915 [Streptomyces sp. MS1.AVA.1]|uniref:NADH-ubiquinone oxidoreductase 51kDa subunit FMN-binding domain-containing protein n=1 Tax=Streptomyces machairae TaxID=3134109 RepID=A0ABU8UGH7_9ACTN